MGVISRLGSIFSDALSPAKHEAQQSAVHIGDVAARLRTRLAAMRTFRDLECAEAVAMDFSALLRAWGMTEQDIPRVIKEMRVRLVVYCALFALAGLVIAQGSPVIGVAIFACAMFGLITTHWRMLVLTGREYFPFPGHGLITALLRIKKSSNGSR
jgi:hypothetical protein